MPGSQTPENPPAPVHDLDIFDLLASLTDRSLIVSEDGAVVRSRMLETVRQYGRELLHQSGESESVRKRHRGYFLDLAELADSGIKGKDQLVWLDALDEEIENVRASLEWSLNGEGSEEAFRLCRALVIFWWRRGHLAEGRDWCTRASETTLGKERTAGRMRVLNGAGMLAWLQGDYVFAHKCLQESYEILMETGDREERSQTLYMTAFAAFGVDDYEAANRYAVEGYEAAKEAGDLWNMANAGYFSGILVRIAGDFGGALRAYKESITIYRQLGDRIGLSYPLYDIGLAEYYRGNFEPARKYLEESLAIRRDTNDLWGMAESQYGLGLVGFGLKDFSLAKSSLGQSLSIGRSIGDKSRIASCSHWLGCIALEEDDPAAAKAHFDEALSLNQELGDRWGLAHSLAGFAALAAFERDYLRAATLWAAAAALREQISSPLPPVEKAQREHDVAAARLKISDEAAFDLAWQEGSAMTFEQGVELIAPTAEEHS